MKLIKSLCICAAMGLSLCGNTIAEVFVLSNPIPGGDNLDRFARDGAFIERQNIQGTSLATDGSRLFVGNGMSIDQYDFAGNFIGPFATGIDGGDDAGSTLLESDGSGNVYVAFRGFFGAERTSFRLDSTGAIQQAYTAPGLVFPTAIDAASNGSTYILNGVGGEDRVYRFDASGVLQGSTVLNSSQNPFQRIEGFTIDESSDELYAVERSGTVNVYDISSDEPQLDRTFQAPPGDYSAASFDLASSSLFLGALPLQGQVGEFGYEVDRMGNLLNTYELPPSGGLITFPLGIVAVPEPTGIMLILSFAGLLLARNRRIGN